MGEVAKSVKKCGKVLVMSGKSRTFVPMKQEKYVITAISRLTGDRVEISGPMCQEMAKERLERELENRRHQRYPTYTRLRVERQLPIQLTIKFSET